MRGHYDNVPPRSFFGSTLGVVAVALGIGFVGAIALDWHRHVCDACGAQWSHLGAFNGGDERAHACPNCGTVQWWKKGASPAQRAQGFVADVTRGVPMQETPPMIAQPPPPRLELAAPQLELVATKEPA